MFLRLMILRSLIVCIYLMIAYWISSNLPSFKMVFYPTLGAFCFLFIQRAGQIKDLRKIMTGAVISVSLGSLFYAIDDGTVSFFLTAITTISLIQYFQWNAAPILAVSLIPYFAHPDSLWILPAAVCLSLAGLMSCLWLTAKMEQLPWVIKLGSLRSKAALQISKPAWRQTAAGVSKETGD